MFWYVACLLIAAYFYSHWRAACKRVDAEQKLKDEEWAKWVRWDRQQYQEYCRQNGGLVPEYDD